VKRWQSTGHTTWQALSVYASNGSQADEVVREIAAEGGQAMAIQADVANANDVERLFRQTLERFDGIQVVVNNAGIMPLAPIAQGNAELFAMSFCGASAWRSC
jgi:3-oxoacyl-[acyl-carrier protein] reductase